MSTSRNLKRAPILAREAVSSFRRWSTNDLVIKYRLKQHTNQCGCKIGLNSNSLDCRKTFLDRFHSETLNFFTALKHIIARTKKFISRGNERERLDFKRESSVWVTLYDFNDDIVICPFFFLAESVFLFLVGEASPSLFSNCKNHFRKRST